MSNLLNASINGDWDMVRSLIGFCDKIDLTDEEEGRTSLMYAVIDKKDDIVKLLLEKGSSVNLQDDNGYTALHFASQNYSLDITKLLLDYNAEVNIQDVNGNTPLSDAVFYSNGEGNIMSKLDKFSNLLFVVPLYHVSPLKLANTIANYDLEKYL